MSDAPAGETLLLDVSSWALDCDANGNVAVASAPYALSQDVASAARTFLGEVWFDTTVGVDYFGKILGHSPAPGVIQQQMVQAALTVPGVVRAQCNLNSFVDTSPAAVSSGSFITDSSGNIVTDSSGNPIYDSSANTTAQTQNLRQVNGQILFVDVNNQSQSVQL
jgi:hypothetical protein